MSKRTKYNQGSSTLRASFAVCQQDGTAELLAKDADTMIGGRLGAIRNGDELGGLLHDGRIVPVRLLSDFVSGEFRGERLREFYPPDAIPDGGIVPTLLAQIRDDVPRLDLPDGWIGRGYRITCVLGGDWEFERILEDARRRRHHRPGRHYPGAHHHLVGLVYDLEEGLENQHPDLGNNGRAAFWTSAEVRRAVREFCQDLVAKGQPGEEVWGAERLLLEQLCSYAHTLQPQGSTKPTLPRRSSRGPEPKIEMHQKVAELLGGVAWGDNLQGSCEILDGAEVPISKSWKKEGYLSWVEAQESIPVLVKKCIRRHSKLGQQLIAKQS
jgi:hypothetical protein